MTMGEYEREYALRAVASFNAGEVDALVEMTHSDCELRGLRYEVDGTTYEGHAGTRDFWKDTSEVWESMRMEDAEILDRDGRALILCRLVLTGRGSGAVVEHDLAWFAELRDGRMYRGRTTLDVEAARREFEAG